MTGIISGIVCSILAIGAFIVSVRSFKEKGFLFNNAYLYASKEERATMDKKPHYRQSAVVFLMIGYFLVISTKKSIQLALSKNRKFYQQDSES